MIPIERLFLLCIALSSVVSCDAKNRTLRNGKHLFALLGYLHGYKMGQDLALQLPPYLLSPIVVLHSVNQQQSVNIQSGSNDENYQESGGTVQAIAPARIVVATNDTRCKQNENLNGVKLNNHVDTEVMKELDKDAKNMTTNTDSEVANKNNSENFTANLRQAQPVATSTTATTINMTATQTAPSNTTMIESNKNGTISNVTGPYPDANYDKDIGNITLTEMYSVINQELPPIQDNRWQNFTGIINQSDIMMDDNTTITTESDNSTTVPMQNVTEATKENGPYPNAWYTNGAIDQLSITTNYYTNESPSPDDGWESYSPMNTLPSGFKPLAGLYYDGYLHKPLKKYGLTPQNYWKYYG